MIVLVIRRKIGYIQILPILHFEGATIFFKSKISAFFTFGNTATPIRNIFQVNRMQHGYFQCCPYHWKKFRSNRRGTVLVVPLLESFKYECGTIRNLKSSKLHVGQTCHPCSRALTYPRVTTHTRSRLETVITKHLQVILTIF